MKRITKVSLFLTILLITLSCNDNTFDTTLVSKTNTKLIEDETFLKNRFSVALANVFCESEASREFIKQEALKQFDYEYDVLYMLIKDRVIENNQTFEDIKHIDENGNEYWYARELQEVLDYKEWRKFENVINKAKRL